MGAELRRTWAEIDLDALAHNYHRAREIAGAGVKYMGVVKADAYGHGAVPTARELERLGADYLAVSSFDEAMELRRAGIAAALLILGHTPPELTSALIEHNITQTVANYNKAEQYSAMAKACGGRLKIHIKVDTGMSRLGFLVGGSRFEGGLDAIERSVRLPNLLPEGIYTHFSAADEDDDDSAAYTQRQLTLFIGLIEALQARGITFALRHCANSGALARFPETYMDMVRPGIALYGAGGDAQRLGLRPVMSLKTTISAIKLLDKDSEVSYGRTFRAPDSFWLGILPVGYADGLMRSLSNRMSFWTPRGEAPICGRICMDMTMVDLRALPDAEIGDEVEIFGRHQQVEKLAQTIGTISYELLCAVSKRVPRLYIKDGAVVERILRIG